MNALNQLMWDCIQHLEDLGFLLTFDSETSSWFFELSSEFDDAGSGIADIICNYKNTDKFETVTFAINQL